MRLAELCSGTDVRLRGDGAVEITDLAYDNRAVAPGSLFFCVRGMSRDGHDFAADAVAAGAKALVVERPLDLGVPEVGVTDARAAMAPLARRFFADPSSDLGLAAVTGTNGKTTTAFLVRSILRAAGRSCGLLGTIRRVIGGESVDAVRTTPEAIDLQRAFREMVDAGDDACSLEISSHALVLGRADAIAVDAAAFTNLTQDHLDFHADMEEYFAAKRSLFTGVPAARRPPGMAVVNGDDAYGRRLLDELAAAPAEGRPGRLLSFSAAGAHEADLSASEVDYDAGGATFVLQAPDGRHRVRLPLPGEFNVANALAAVGLASGLGVGFADAAAALADAEPVPGRMEPILAGQPFAVLVDYAHTPDSLENVLAAARRIAARRLICVFGCGGDRDRAKRPLMGQAAAEGCDLPVLTSDNPRNERPEAILADVLEGVAERERMLVEVDRRAAIGLALERAEPGDLVLIAGKGHEQGQEFEQGRKVPFDDREVAREALRDAGYAARATRA